ncbi:MAG: hypothetical protein Kow0090_07630 [Myxococcota bacterium]
MKRENSNSNNRHKKARLKPLSEFSLSDVEAIRLLLRGGSIVDWHRLDFQNIEEVNKFLYVNLLDVNDPVDRYRLDYLFHSAMEYLGETYGYRFPQKIANAKNIQTLFLFASSKKKDRTQVLSCSILKLMHTIQHIEAREILFNTRVSTQEVAQAAQERISRLIDKIQRDTDVIVEFSGGQKTRSSIVTKLLSKKENVATIIFDRIRFRLVVRRRRDILPLLNYMITNLLPFNYVVPLESHNTLIPFSRLIERNRYLSRYRDKLQLDIDIEAEEAKESNINIFSGKTFRTINFVSDLPLRVDKIVPDIDPDLVRRLGRIIFANVEFQIVDYQTHLNNERGENSHVRYKARQLAMVQDRLRRGLLKKREEKDVIL